ncbi:MAG: PilN domain-containing protein [Candidatus Omnitrophota bacterium]
MKKKSSLFTIFKPKPVASLLLEETEASLTLRSGWFTPREVRQEFRAENFEDLLGKVKERLQANPPCRLTVLLNHSFFLERTLFFPFSKKRLIALVLPEELESLLPSPLSEYLYGFIVPEEPHLPVTVILLPVKTWHLLKETFQPFRWKIRPGDLLLNRHPAVKGKGNVLILVKRRNQARIILFQKGKFVTGRSFLFTRENYEQRLSEESRFFLRSNRLPEDLKPVEVYPDERLALSFVFRSQDFSFRTQSIISFWSRTSTVYAFSLVSLAILGIFSFLSFHARNTASLSYQKVNDELRRQETFFPAGDIPLSDLFSDRTMRTMLQGNLSPLETLNAFTESLPADLPLILNYLTVDREKMTINGTLNSPSQVDRLLESLLSSGHFKEPVLGELKLETGTVKFPLTVKIQPAEVKANK